MKKPIKILLSVLVVILVSIAILALLVDLFVDKALEFGIEAGASKTLNVGVSVSNVDLEIIKGSLELENLVINNPPGYQHEKLLELKDGRIKIDTKSLFSDTVIVETIKLDGIVVSLEQRGISSNNLQDVIKTISAGTKDAKEKTAKKEGRGKKLHVARLEITNVTVKAKMLPVPGKADTVTLMLDPIIMEELGSDDKMDTAVLSSKIFLAIANGIAKKGTGILPKEITGPMGEELKNIGGLSKNLLKDTKELGEGLMKEGTDKGKDLTEGIKGLFNPQK